MRRRRRARLAVGEALHSPRYFALVLNLNEFAATVHERRGLAQAAVPVGATLLSGCYRQLRRRAKHLVDGTATERHAVRIAAKKLRYTADFFGSLFAGRKCDKFVRALSKVQEALGLLNDLATTRTLMASLAVGEDMQVQRTLGLCIGWSSGLEQGLITELARCWKGVERAARFWPEAADQASIAKGANDSLPDDGSPVTSL
jgi:CHAD domain-containing protein